MKITGNENENAILTELGRRIKQYRIALGITQAELAEKCGISTSTETRIESGADSKISNHLKILYGLGLLSNADTLIPEPQPDFKSLYEKTGTRQRVKQGKHKNGSGWTWEEDK